MGITPICASVFTMIVMSIDRYAFLESRQVNFVRVKKKVARKKVASCFTADENTNRERNNWIFTRKRAVYYYIIISSFLFY